MEWQPIETAQAVKKAGQRVLLASNLGHVTSGRWIRHIRGWATDIGTFHPKTTALGKRCKITHWMPYPAHPES